MNSQLFWSLNTIIWTSVKHIPESNTQSQLSPSTYEHMNCSGLSPFGQGGHRPRLPSLPTSQMERAPQVGGARGAARQAEATRCPGNPSWPSREGPRAWLLLPQVGLPWRNPGVPLDWPRLSHLHLYLGDPTQPASSPPSATDVTPPVNHPHLQPQLMICFLENLN